MNQCTSVFVYVGSIVLYKRIVNANTQSIRIANADGQGKCVFTFNKPADLDMDEFILEFIDLGIDDEYDEEGNEVTIYGDPKSFGMLQKALEEKGFEITGNEFTRIPNDLKDVNDEQRAAIEKIVERLEEDDDVQNVYTNMRPAE